MSLSAEPPLSHQDDEVAIGWGPPVYDVSPPFSPGAKFPEYPPEWPTGRDGANTVYATVRETFRLLGLDAEHYGSPRWNPLKDIVRPGERVVLKPNLVREYRETLPGLDDCVITHGSVIRAVLDYVYIALQGKGRIIIADSPSDDADFKSLRKLSGLDAMVDFYQHHAGFPIELYDLRMHRDYKINGLIVGRDLLPGDPAGYITVDLGKHSRFHEIEEECHRLYGATYNVHEIRRHHADGRHEYQISRTVLGADCVILLPKLKTHQKVGITVNMKLLVGICGNKDCIAHYRVGVPIKGGDQFAGSGMRERLERVAVGTFKQYCGGWGPQLRVLARPLRWIGEEVFGRTNEVIRSGNWHGNDTAWRMVHDLTRIILHADAEGELHDYRSRRIFCVVDGIIGGQGNGPLDPDPCPLGAIVAGTHPVAVDLACTRLIGFDESKLPLLHDQMDRKPYPLLASDRHAMISRSNRPAWCRPLAECGPSERRFRPHFGWVGTVELPLSSESRPRKETRAPSRRMAALRSCHGRPRAGQHRVPIDKSIPLPEAGRRSPFTQRILWCLAHGITAATEFIVRLFPPRRHTGRRHHVRSHVMLTGTFLADNWLEAHVRPIAMSPSCDRVTVVSDEPKLTIPKVHYWCPPRWLQRVMGRVAARSLYYFAAVWRYQPDWCGGFHLLCNGLVALIAARLTGARSLYFSVGGRTEVIGGGATGENRIFGGIGALDWALERSLLRLVDSMDQVVTMGTGARRFFQCHGVEVPIEAIPGGIDDFRYQSGEGPREFDVILVARLVPVKRIDIFLKVIQAAARELPAIRAVIVGDGPLRSELELQARQWGIADRVTFAGHQTDVASWLRRSRIFVLTSDSEGLALSIMEAMMSGLPCVVSEVGDLGDLVHHGRNGWLVPRRQVEQYAGRIVDLLKNPAALTALAAGARSAALKVKMAAIAERWTRLLADREPVERTPA